MLLRRAMVLAVAALAVPAGAGALPGDPPVEQLTPAEGGAVAPNADGIAVTYTCPTYRFADSGSGIFLFGDYRQYGVVFSTSPALDAEGRLAAPGRVALSGGQRSSELPAGQCVGFMYDSSSGAANGPQNTPGTYYWQAYRICSACALPYEVSAVRSFTVRAAVDMAVRPPRRAFAGYAAFFSLKLAGVPDRTVVELQRRVGSAWRTVGRATAGKGAGEAAAVLPAGRSTLRVRAAIGAQVEVSPEAAVTVVKGASRVTSGRDDGRYTGSPGSPRFRVSGGGREVRDLRMTVNMLCAGVVAGQLTTQAGAAVVPRAPIAPDGSFFATLTRSGTSVTVRGTLRSGRVSGATATLSAGQCSGSATFSARRAGA